MTVIDLGELTEPTDREPPRRRGPIGNRRLGAGLVALVVLLALAGSASPAARVHATVPAGLGSDLLLTTDQIFTVTPAPGVTDGTQELVAYPRPEHATVTPQQLAPLWRVPLPSGSRVFQASSAGEFGVLFSMGRPTRSSANGLETWLLDSRTGQERWRAPGIATFGGAGRVLLRTFADQESMMLRAVELADGRDLWSSSFLTSWTEFHERDGVIDAIVVTRPAGDVEVLDPATGEARHRLPPIDDDPGGYLQASVVGDLVVVIRNSRTVIAYQLDGLIQRWQTTVPLADYATQCGVLICGRIDSGGAYLLDPGTGALRWSIPETVDVLLADGARALAVTTRAGDTPEVVAVDSATGATLTEYGSWNLVTNWYASELLGTRAVPGVGLVVARLDLAEPRPRYLDVLVGAVGDCHQQGDLIACRRENGEFGVWRLRG